VVKELYPAKSSGVLSSWSFQGTAFLLVSCIFYELNVGLTKQWTQEKPYIANESEVAERPCLCLLCAVFAKHSSNRDDSTSKDTRKTSSNDHLPQRLAHAEQSGGDRNTNQGENKNRFPPVAIRSLRRSV
jgi:hypothetical protein